MGTVSELSGGDRDVVASGCEVVQRDGGKGERGLGQCSRCEVIRYSGGAGRVTVSILETWKTNRCRGGMWWRKPKFRVWLSTQADLKPRWGRT